jgi:hypothetical protein
MKKIRYAACLLTVALSAQAGIYQAWEFNTSGDEEGWVGNGNISGLTQAADIDSVNGVLTAADVTGNDPFMNIPSLGLTPTAGQTWDTVVIRLRTLNDNPGAAGVASEPFVESGTRFAFNAIGYANLLSHPLSTVETEANNWTVVTIDISGNETTTLNSIRFDPQGNLATRNFEIDYMRLNVVPEPATLGLVAVMGGAILFIRRRFMI